MKKPLRSANDRSTNLSIKDILSTSEIARNAFEKLVKEGVEASYLERTLPFLPTLSDELGDMIPGKTDKTARNFPDRLERFAEEIQATNERGWLLYDLLVSSETETRRAKGGKVTRPLAEDQMWALQGGYQQTLSEFLALPHRLHAYAAYFRSAIRNRQSRDNFQKFVVIHMLEKVKSATGKFYYYEYVGTLCKAAFEAAGRDAPKYLENLDKLYRHNPRLHTHPNKSSTRK